MKNKSFTLIELLVVIVIIGILAGVIMISTSSSLSKAKLAKGLAFSDNIKKGLFFDLVSEWTFDDADMGKDEEGHKNLAIQNVESKEGEECLFSKCAYFLGNTTSYAQKSSFPMPTSDLTIDTWFKIVPDGSANQFIFSYAVDSSANELLLGKEGAGLGLYTNGGHRFYNIKISSDKWHNLVFVRDRTTDNNADNIVYFDGVYIKSISDTSGDLTSGGCLVLGQDQDSLCGGFDSNQSFKGLLDNVRIYDTVLDEARIKQNYALGLKNLLAKSKITKQEYNKRINE